jgi:hypothetical protein
VIWKCWKYANFRIAIKGSVEKFESPSINDNFLLSSISSFQISNQARMAFSIPPGDIQTQPNAKIVFNSPYDDKLTYHIKVSSSFWLFVSCLILVLLDHQLECSSHRLGDQDQ